jgi:hypothetical protein
MRSAAIISNTVKPSPLIIVACPGWPLVIFFLAPLKINFFLVLDRAVDSLEVIGIAIALVMCWGAHLFERWWWSRRA